MLGKILGGLAALVIIVIALGFVLPDKVHLEREIVVNAPQEEVFALVSDLEVMSTWSPWADIDPDAKYTITGTGVGQTMSWTSDHPEVGNGSQTITAINSPNSVDAHLDFGDMGQADAKFTLSSVDDGTRVVWGFDSKMREGVPFYMKPMSTYMGFFMDGMLGPTYEEGLENLKRAAESGA